MPSAAETGRFRPRRRRPNLELGITPLIDIVFLLLIFFMLTSRFIVSEGIQVELPVTRSLHDLPAEEALVITILSGGELSFLGRPMTLPELEAWLDAGADDVLRRPFEIRSDREASVQSVVSVLELLRKTGASRVTLKTTSGQGS